MGSFLHKTSEKHFYRIFTSVFPRKFYMRRNKNKVDYTEIGRIVIPRWLLLALFFFSRLSILMLSFHFGFQFILFRNYTVPEALMFFYISVYFNSLKSFSETNGMLKVMKNHSKISK